MNQATMDKLIREWDERVASGTVPAQLGEYLLAALSDEAALLRRMAGYRRSVRRHEEEATLAGQTTEAILALIQADCPHHERTYHRDAAGGSDSYTRCNLCQKVL
jgi:hypothetical protein